MAALIHDGQCEWCGCGPAMRRRALGNDRRHAICSLWSLNQALAALCLFFPDTRIFALCLQFLFGRDVQRVC